MKVDFHHTTYLHMSCDVYMWKAFLTTNMFTSSSLFFLLIIFMIQKYLKNGHQWKRNINAITHAEAHTNYFPSTTCYFICTQLTSLRHRFFISYPPFTPFIIFTYRRGSFFIFILVGGRIYITFFIRSHNFSR